MKQHEPPYASAALRITSRVLSVDAIANALGITPDRSHNVGDPIGRRASPPAFRTETVFLVDSGHAEVDPPEDHLDAVLSIAESVADGLHGLANKCEAEVVLAYGNGTGQGGMVLTVQNANRLVLLGLDLLIDFFPPHGVSVE